MLFDLGNGIYDDGDFICGFCIAGFTVQFEVDQASRCVSDISKQANQAQASTKKQLSPQPSRKTKEQRKRQAISPSHSTQVSEEQLANKLSKADRLAKNIQIMLKSKGSLCLNPSNEKAFHLAVRQLGMRLDEFHIEHDGFYLEIRLKRDCGKDTNNTAPLLLKRPELPKCDRTS
jgi:hypothetical protein